MGEGFLSVLGMSPWGPIALAFLLGVAFGWVIWGAGRGGRVIDKRERLAGEEGEPKEIVVIKAELQAARRLLDQGDDQDAAVAEQLSALDETVKRANGRLKTILAAVKRLAGKG
ncbi:MAG: hypothetical protein ACOZAA_17985 [Pseudomonadota bacterium]